LPEARAQVQLSAMKLDHESPVPLYVQLVEAIRLEIARGGLMAGEMLPALRQAARRWGVNLHTVRRAYGELALLGLVRTDPQRGTFVTEGGGDALGADETEAFLTRFIGEARERFGLGVAELGHRLDRWGSRSRLEPQPVRVFGTSEAEASALASGFPERWGCEASASSSETEPPDGGCVLLAPLHALPAVRARVPRLLPWIEFLPIRFEGGLGDALASPPSKIFRAVVCDPDPAVAEGLAAEIQAALPPGRAEIAAHATDRPEDLLASVPTFVDTIAFTPWLWAALSPADRNHPKAAELRYGFDDDAVRRVLGRTGRMPRRDGFSSPSSPVREAFPPA